MASDPSDGFLDQVTMPDLGDRALFWTARTFGLSIDRLYALGAFRLLMMVLRRLS